MRRLWNKLTLMDYATQEDDGRLRWWMVPAGLAFAALWLGWDGIALALL